MLSYDGAWFVGRWDQKPGGVYPSSEYRGNQVTASEMWIVTYFERFYRYRLGVYAEPMLWRDGEVSN